MRVRAGRAVGRRGGLRGWRQVASRKRSLDKPITRPLPRAATRTRTGAKLATLSHSASSFDHRRRHRRVPATADAHSIPRACSVSGPRVAKHPLGRRGCWSVGRLPYAWHHGHGGRPAAGAVSRGGVAASCLSVGTGERKAGLGHSWQPNQHPGHNGGDRHTNEPMHGTPPLQMFRTGHRDFDDAALGRLPVAQRTGRFLDLGADVLSTQLTRLSPNQSDRLADETS